MAIRNLLLVFILLYAADSLGAVYRCTDTSGRVIYSDTACATKADRQSVELQPLSEVKAEQSFLARMTEKFKGFFQSTSNIQPATSTPNASTTTNKSPNYTCDGRTYCSQMTSCEEATFFTNNCPDTKMDGNNDGIPCEKQWCR